MVFFNYALRKLNAKIVYYGPGLCGKTTNLQWIHDHFEGGQRGKMISLATEGDRTIFFDLLPIDIGSIRGMDVTLQLYTVPGQVHYNSTRQLVLRGADGVVFVGDSQRTMKSSNAESFENLQENLMLQGIDLKEFPHILQFNKRDLRDLLSPEDLNESLNVFSVPIFEAIATEGIGVQESLEGIVKLVMRNLREKYEPVANAGIPQGLKPMQATPPAAPLAAEPAVEEPAEVKPDPLASDFVSEFEQPAPVVPPDPVPPPSFEIPTSVMPPADETADVGIDSGFAAFQDEDGIATAVYEGADTQIAEIEAAIGSSTFPVDEDTAASKADPEELEHDPSGGLFTDPRDEDGTSDVVAPDVDFGVADVIAEPEPDPDPDVPEDMSTDPEIVKDDLVPETTEESMDDLFEAEPPTVKAYIDDVMDVVETEGSALTDADDAPLPPLVDTPRMEVAPLAENRFEDRIQAPGPFAPPPASETDQAEAEVEAEAEPEIVEPPVEPEPEIDTASESEHEMIHDEIRQAFGSSENREALASLSIDKSVVTEDPEPDEGPAGFLDDPPEVQPVIPPAPEESEIEEPEIEEPDETDPVEFVTETTPEPFESIVVEAPEEQPALEVAEEADLDSAETVVDEFVKMDPIIAEPPAPEEPDEPEAHEELEEPDEPEGTVEEPVEEPVIEQPPVDSTIDKSQPFMFGLGDPFSSDEADVAVAEILPPETPIVPAAASAIDVTAANNQLHLQLKGSGAIAEMGQVRALDIEVPVPGQWVGNQKVTLQLRLTLTPSEDEND